MIYKTIVICSGLICAQSCFTCIMQAFVYPFIVGKLKVPVPYLAVFGTIIQSMDNHMNSNRIAISYFFMSYSNTLWGAMIASTGLWLGFTFAVPSAVSIISVCNLLILLYYRQPMLLKFKAKYSHGITFAVNFH